MAYTKTQHHCYKVQSELWSLWYKERKISDTNNVIYDLVHGDEAFSYWQRKGKTEHDVTNNVAWEAIGVAMKGMHVKRQHFISKHSVGMCGIGKCILCWKKWDTDGCPRCNQQEMAAHVWACARQGAENAWDTACNQLQEWLESHQTDPEIAAAIIMGLWRWQHGSQDDTGYSWQIRNAVDQQHNIGWQHMVEGWMCLEWEGGLQQAYLMSIGSTRMGRCCVVVLIRKLWMIAWDLWEHRNEVLYNQENLVSAQMAEKLDRDIQRTYCRAVSVLSHTRDNYLLTAPVSQLLTRSIPCKQAWLTTTNTAIQVQRQHQCKWWQELNKMREVLHCWLRGNN